MRFFKYLIFVFFSLFSVSAFAATSYRLDNSSSYQKIYELRNSSKASLCSSALSIWNANYGDHNNKYDNYILFDNESTCMLRKGSSNERSFPFVSVDSSCTADGSSTLAGNVSITARVGSSEYLALVDVATSKFSGTYVCTGGCRYNYSMMSGEGDANAPDGTLVTDNYKGRYLKTAVQCSSGSTAPNDSLVADGGDPQDPKDPKDPKDPTDPKDPKDPTDPNGSGDGSCNGTNNCNVTNNNLDADSIISAINSSASSIMGSISNAVSSITSSISNAASSITNSVNGVSSKLDSTNNKLDSANARLNDINSNTAAANSKLDQVNNKLTQTNSLLDSMKNLVNDLKTVVNTVSSKLDTTNSKLNNIESAQQSTNQKLDTTNQNLDDIKTGQQATNAKIDGTNTRLDTANKNLDDIKTGQQATNAKIDGTNTRLDTANKNLDDIKTKQDTTNEHLNDIKDWLKDESGVDFNESGNVDIATEEITTYTRQNHVVFGASCPFSSNTIVIDFGISSFSFNTDLSFICDFGYKARPYVIGLGHLAALLFLLIGLRNGNA